MRLIDADYFKKQTAAAALKSNAEQKGLALIKLIDNQPTAYDVEKVGKQLEEKIMGDETIRFVDQAVGKALEIVKQGGVGADDVCEWIKYDYRTLSSPHERYWMIPDNDKQLRYCPYCSKKIKVVE